MNIVLALTLTLFQLNILISPTPPKQLTVKNASINQLMKYCPKFDTYTAMPGSIYATSTNMHIFLIKNCMDIENLLIVSWVGEGEEIDTTFAKLVILHYVAFHEENQGISGSVKLINIKSKADKRFVDKKKKFWFVIYNYNIKKQKNNTN